MKKHTEPLLFDTYYHIFNRGVNKCDIFSTPTNYTFFLDRFKKYVLPVAEVYAYALMVNHFHIIVKTRTEEQILQLLQLPDNQITTEKYIDKPHLYLHKQFSHLFNSYAQAYNKMNYRTGALFEEPFRRVIIADERYFANLIAYIHFNPQKHGFTKDFRTYQHTSYRALLSTKPTLLERQKVVEWFGGVSALQQFHELEFQDEQVDDFE